MGREFEWKFAASEESISALQQRFAPLAQTSMETTYYDTVDWKLSMHHWTLRRRLENGISVCTLKTPRDDGSRSEWEVEADSIAEGILELYRQGAPAELVRCTASGVKPVCGARFTRLSAVIPLPEAKAELALDRGVLLGQGREAPLLEIEVELKEGSEAAVTAFAQSLAEEFSLVQEPRSKFARAMTLAMGGMV